MCGNFEIVWHKALPKDQWSSGFNDRYHNCRRTRHDLIPLIVFIFCIVQSTRVLAKSFSTLATVVTTLVKEKSVMIKANKITHFECDRNQNSI